MHARLSHALVLAAGLGTRLRPLTHVRAKPALPLAGTPLVERIVGWLVAQDVTQLVLNLHHRPETIARVVGDGSHLGARVRYSWEQPAVLGSAGGPRLAAPIVGDDPFLIVNGDTLTDLDVRALADAHHRMGGLVTMAVVPNREPDRYGGVRLDAQGRVVGFAARGPSAAGTCHFVGVQVAHAEAFAGVRPGTAANSVGEVYDRLLAARPGSVRGLVCEAAFWDIGTVPDYWRTSRAFAEEAAGAGDRATLGRGAGGHLDPHAVVRDCILWDRVTVGPRAVLDGCIVTDDVAVPAGACHRDAILWRDPQGGLMVSPRPQG